MKATINNSFAHTHMHTLTREREIQHGVHQSGNMRRGNALWVCARMHMQRQWQRQRQHAYKQTPLRLSLPLTLSYWTHFPPNPLGGVKPHPGTQHYKCQKVEKRRKKYYQIACNARAQTKCRTSVRATAKCGTQAWRGKELQEDVMWIVAMAIMWMDVAG